ncbi:MAG: hypothetical protein AMXMBFR7_48900 [Planctomycetota bacterium]
MSHATALACPPLESAPNFEDLLPELSSRLARMTKKLPKRIRDAAFDDALGAAWLNFSSASRRGNRLSAKALGWAACKHLKNRSTITALHYPSRRPEIPVALDEVAADPTSKLAQSLTTDEHQSPFERARVRFDWQAFARTQPPRVRVILAGLAEGYSKSEIALGLGISRGRLSQLLTELAHEILAYGHAEPPPHRQGVTSVTHETILTNDSVEIPVPSRLSSKPYRNATR